MARSPRKRAPTTLYHGTLRSLERAIRAEGLRPMVGATVQSAYDVDRSTAPLVFAADDPAATIAAVRSQITAATGRPQHRVTRDDVAALGMVVEVPTSSFRRCAEGESMCGLHPPHVEEGDWYSARAVRPTAYWGAAAMRDLADGRAAPAGRVDNPGRRLTVVAAHVYPRRHEYATDVGSYVRGVAHDLKSAERRAVREAAAAMAPLIPPRSTLVPLPDHRGSTRANLALAEAIARFTGGSVVDGLDRRSGESQHARSMKGLPRLGPDRIEVRWTGGALRDPVVLIDNVVVSGATALAAAQAIGRDAVVLAWARDADGGLARASNPAERWREPLGRWPSTTLCVGSELFHGGEDVGRFYRPNWPTFFTDSAAVAARWSHGRGYTVYRFVVTRGLHLLQLDGYGDLDDVARSIDHAAGESGRYDGEIDPREVALEVCEAGLDGWHIERGDLGGPDIVICKPRGSVRCVGSTRVGGSPTAAVRRPNPPPQAWQLTLKEFLAYHVPSPLADRSTDPGSVPELRAASELLSDYADPSRDYELMDLLGRGYDPRHDVAVLAEAVRAGRPIRVYRATNAERSVWPGAYVTTSRAYADDHGERNMGLGRFHVVDRLARPDELVPMNPNELLFAPADVAAWHRAEVDAAVARGDAVPGRVLLEHASAATGAPPPRRGRAR